MKIVGELTDNPIDFRKKLWLETLALPLEWKEFSDAERENPLFLIKKPGVDGVLIGPEISDLLFPAAPSKPTAVIEASFADSVIREQTTMWLRCFLKESLKQLILIKSPSLDTHSTCYLTGSSNLMRLCAVVAVQMGFKKLVIIADDYEMAVERIANLKKLFFDLEILILRETELTLQPNNGSLLMNTVTAEQSAVVFEDLTYLNFLHKKGLVVDLPISLSGNALLEEATHVGLLQVSGLEIWGARDWMFLKNILKDEFTISLSEYQKSWETLAHSEI